VLAIVTAGIATIVSSPVVDTDGLYQMPNFSYTINSWKVELLLLVWGIVIGPLAGLLAAGFRGLTKLVQTLQPEGRIPLAFEDAREGMQAWFTRSRDGLEVQDRAIILGFQGERVQVHFDGELEEDDITLFMWYEMDPRGSRDWVIVVAMPAAFLLLGMLAFNFPCLLGNGRALAMAAFNHDRTGRILWVLFFMKAVVTLAAIGSGAAGGTLTPSVALGATLGVAVGELWNFGTILPDLDLQALGLISAGAFLAAAMRCPLTGVFLLIEFAAQGIKRQDLLKVFYGDLSGLLQSRLTLPVLLPMALAALLSTRTEKAVQNFIELAKQAHVRDKEKEELEQSLLEVSKTPSERTIARRRSSKLLADIPIDYEEEVPADDRMLDLSYRGFRIGVFLNTCLTLGCAAAIPRHHGEKVTNISAAGVACAFLTGVALGIHTECRITLKSQSRESLSDSSIGSSSSKSKRVAKENFAQAAFGIAWVAFFSAVGALPPFLPWALEIWRHEGYGNAALLISVFSSVAVSAFGAMVDALDQSHGYIKARPHQKKRRKAVLKQALGTLLVACIACFTGAACGKVTGSP
jgi:H+/Cl- antiporter ClcA